MTTHIAYGAALDLLMQQGGMRKREAEALLASNYPEPDFIFMRALRITRRRWRVKNVVDFCAAWRETSAPLGKGALEVAANHKHS